MFENSAASEISELTGYGGWRRWLRWIMVALAASAWLVMVGALAVISVNQRSRLLEEALRGDANIANAIEGNVTDGMANIDVVLAGIEDFLQRIPPERWRDEPEVRATLMRRLPQAPLARSILLVGVDGKSIAATNLPADAQPVDLSDREYVAHHRRNPGSRLHVSKPVRSRADQRWVILASRRIEDAKGVFNGIAVASVDLAALAADLDVFTISPAAALSIIDSNGYVLARRPDHSGVAGMVLANHSVRMVDSGRTFGSFESPSPIDNRPRVFSYQRSLTYPLTGLAGSDPEEILAPWRRQLAVHVAVGFVFSLGIGLFTFHVLKRLRRHEAILADLDRARREAEEANRAKSLFLAGMSHELRTPLNAILGFSEVIAKQLFGQEPQDKYTEYSADINKSAKNLLALIEDLLDMARIEAGYFELRLQSVELVPVIDDCLNELRDMAQARGVAVTSRVDPGFPRLFCDERVLRQVLVNILINTLRFTPSGGGIEIEAGRSADGDIEVMVSDTGPGIPIPERTKLMFPFDPRLASGGQEAEGSGLRLPISRKLVEIHGGRLSIEEGEGGGTRTRMVMPPSRIFPDEPSVHSSLRKWSRANGQ